MIMTDAYATASIAAQSATVAAVGPLDGAKFGLFTNNLTPTPQTPLSALVEPTYTGYARQTAVFGPPGRDQNGLIGIFSTRLLWQESAPAVAENIFGIFLVDTTGLIMFGCELFPTPIPLSDILDYIATVTEILGSFQGQANTTVVE